jgi:hypothetical protein
VKYKEEEVNILREKRVLPSEEESKKRVLS